MKPSATIILVVIAAVIFAAGLALAGLFKPSHIESNESKSVEPANVTVPEENVSEPLPAPVRKCGDGKCESDERCDAKTNTTVCPEDCGYTCPSWLIVHSKPNATSTESNSYYCGNENCKQIDSNTFVIRDNTSIKTRITNLGEQYSSDVTSNFLCEKVGTEVSATKDDEFLAELIVRDYFGSEKESLELRPKRLGNYSTEYNLEFTFTEDVQPMDVYCFVSLRSKELLNQQGINIQVRL